MMVCLLLKPILIGFNEKGLPYEGCFCFEISTLSRFWIAYLHQFIFANACCLSVAASDTLFSGLLIQVCAQSDLLKSRLANLLSSKTNRGQCDSLIKFVKQHIRLRR